MKPQTMWLNPNGHWSTPDAWSYHARGCTVKLGPQIVKFTLTPLGAKFAAWRLNRGQKR